jgi:hypothetical protein
LGGHVPEAAAGGRSRVGIACAWRCARRPPGSLTAGAAGIGDPYHPLDGNGGYDVQHYDLHVSYDPATDKIVREATIEANATQNLSASNLGFVGMRLRSVTVDGVKAVATHKGQELTVKPKTPAATYSLGYGWSATSGLGVAEAAALVGAAGTL